MIQEELDSERMVDIESPFFEVEKVLDRRVRNGKREYFIKWQGYDSDDDSWTPEKNMDPELVNEYEKELEEKKKQSKPVAKKEGKKPEEDKDSNLNGFEQGLIPERIIGATDALGEYHFLIKWQGRDEASLVPSSQANVKCPQLVIKFYEERLTWHDA